MTRSKEDKLEMIFIVSAENQYLHKAERQFNLLDPDRPVKQNTKNTWENLSKRLGYQNQLQMLLNP